MPLAGGTSRLLSACFDMESKLKSILKVDVRRDIVFMCTEGKTDLWKVRTDHVKVIMNIMHCYNDKDAKTFLQCVTLLDLYLVKCETVSADVNLPFVIYNVITKVWLW